MWVNTLKASSSSHDGSDNVVQHDIIQVLCPIRKYHFDDAYVCFTKDAYIYSFIQHLQRLPTIQYEGTYDLFKMSEKKDNRSCA